MRAPRDRPGIGLAPSRRQLTTLDRRASQEGQAEKAEMLLNTMADTGLTPDALSFTGVISGYARTAQPEKAAKVLGRMLGANVPPDTVVFNSVLLAYANANDADGAMRTFQDFERYTFDDCPNVRLTRGSIWSL